MSMQQMGVTGKIYGIKDTTKGDKPSCSFRVSVRKRWVSDNDKQANRTNTFVPIFARGKTAEIILQNYKEGDVIAVGDMEYQTWKSDQNQQYDDRHGFVAERISYFPLNGSGEGEAAPARQSGNSGGGRQTSDRRESQPARQASGGRQSSRPAQQEVDISPDDLPF